MTFKKYIYFFAFLQSMPSLHISKRSTSHTQPTQPSKEKKKVPKHIRDYVKRQFRKSFEIHRQGLLNELRGRKTPGQDCPTSCKGKFLSGKSPNKFMPETLCCLQSFYRFYCFSDSKWITSKIRPDE